MVDVAFPATFTVTVCSAAAVGSGDHCLYPSIAELAETDSFKYQT